jgi:hypothetical protein
MFNRTVAAIKKLLFSKKGSSPVVSFVILAPLILVVAFGISWFGHMADAQNVVEEAARAGARWLAAHPGDIDGAKARAAEVVEGAIGGKYIAGGNIDAPNLNTKLIGKLTKIGHKYYITDRNFGSVRVKPANGSIKKTMESLLNRTVVADGTWKNVDVFKVEVATTNPPETQTVNQTVPEQSGENGGGGGSSNTQTVGQTRHPGPFAAAALARYGEGPWGTNWGAWAYPQQGSGTVPTNGALRIQATSHNTNKYSSEWTSPNGKKIYRIHIKGKSERNYDYGYVYGWNGSSWVQLVKRCSPSSNAEYDEWVDVSSYNVTKLKTRLTTDRSVLYSPTYVDVVEVDTNHPSSLSVSSNGALKVQVSSHRADKYSGEWAAPGAGKILRIHMKGKSERNYDYGYVYGWNGSSWVQLAKECSPSSNAEYDKWIDVSKYNVTKLKTRLTTDGSVLYSPTYVDVPKIVVDRPINGSPFDSSTWWIWGQSGADRCALNGQEVQLSKSCFLTYYATYTAYAAADDHFKVRFSSQSYSNPSFLSGDATWVNGVVPASEKTLWVTKPGSSMYPKEFASVFTINAWNDYGPAGAIFALKHTGWHWDTSYKGYNAYNNGYYYYYPWVRVPTAQYVMVTAKNNQGSPITIRVWNGSTNYEGTGTLTFFAEANTGGNYPAYLIYVKSSTPFNDVQVVFSEPYSVVCTDSSWQYTPVDGVKYSSVTLPTNVQPGKTFNVQVQVANTGHKEWYGTAVPSWWPSSYGNGTTRLSYHWYDQSGNLVVMGGLKTSFPGVVNPGTAVNRTMTIQAPSQPGTYKLVIDCVQEDVAWFGPVQGVNWPTIEANILVGGKQRDVYFSPVAVPKYMITGQRYTIRVTVTNKGTTAWSQSKCRLGYYWVDKNGKKLNERGYDLPLNVQPGSSVTFDMAVAAPSKPGAYSLVISMASVTQNGLAWWCEDDQDPCPYIKADVQIPDGDLLQGMITYDGEDYWIGMTLLDSQGPDLSTLAGKDAIVWGEGKGPEQKIFIASSIEEYFPNDWNAVVTFDPDKDVLCNDPVAGDPEAPAGDPVGQPRADGYAYCRVTYHYPVPLRGFWRMVSHAGVPLWRGEEPPSRSLIGEAFFVSGEAGDQS